MTEVEAADGIGAGWVEATSVVSFGGAARDASNCPMSLSESGALTAVKASSGVGISDHGKPWRVMM